MTHARRFVGTLVMLASGCTAEQDPALPAQFPGRSEPFIAMAGDFEGFEAWRSVDLPAAVSGHAGAPRKAWINHPGLAAGPWPVGTMTVKTGDQPLRWLAMVKRGGGYNADGLKGWEFFELTRNGLGEMVVYWRGVGPPAGEEYGEAGQTCNACHAVAAKDGLFLW